jgi:hypothetical protein
MTLLIGASLAWLTPASPAPAALREFSDAADAPGLDIRAVPVQYGNWLQITARHQGEVRFDQTYRYYIDTFAGNPGPEYYFEMHPDSDAFLLRRIDSFQDTTKQAVHCGQLWGGAADAFRPFLPVVARINARCLGSPARVSVSLRFTDIDGSVDWAPGPRQRYSWVTRY